MQVQWPSYDVGIPGLNVYCERYCEASCVHDFNGTLTWVQEGSTSRIFKLFMCTERSSSSTALSRSSWVLNGITSYKIEKWTGKHQSEKERMWQCCRHFHTYNNTDILTDHNDYLIIGVMQVHALAKCYFSFGAQIFQTDRTWEL